MIGSGTLHARLDRARARAMRRGASEVELSYAGHDRNFFRFSNSKIGDAGFVEERKVRVRVLVGRVLGASSTSLLDDEGLDEAVDRALLVARANGARKAEMTGFASSKGPSCTTPQDESALPPTYDAATAEHPPGDAANALQCAFAVGAKHELRCAGSLSYGPREFMVLTSGGACRHHVLTRSTMSMIAYDGDASGYRAFHDHRITALDVRALTEAASRDAVRCRERIELRPGTFDVVLMPTALAELLEWMAIVSFSGRGLLDRSSLLCGRDGEKIASESVTIVDDCRSSTRGSVCHPFDAEGCDRSRVAFVEAGRAADAVSDLDTAAQLGRRHSTGHAAPIDAEEDTGPVAQNIVFSAGEATVDELVARVESGVLVTRFHYVNGLLEPSTATMTGTTKDGTFAIANGEVGPAVQELRFTQSVLAALCRVGGIGCEHQAVPTTWIPSGVVTCPAVLLRDFHFSGSARGDA